MYIATNIGAGIKYKISLLLDVLFPSRVLHRLLKKKFKRLFQSSICIDNNHRRVNDVKLREVGRLLSYINKSGKIGRGWEEENEKTN